MKKIFYKVIACPELLLGRITVDVYKRFNNKHIGTMLIVGNDDNWEITRNQLFELNLIGKGIGYLMLQKALEYLKNEGIKEVRVVPKVEPSYEKYISEEALIKSYEKQGFVKSSEDKSSGRFVYVLKIK